MGVILRRQLATHNK